MTSRYIQPLLVAAGLFTLATSSAWAQEETIYIGGASARSAVQVDMSVLDGSAGAPYGDGQRLLPPTASSQRVVLTPPGQKAPKAASQRRVTAAKPVTPRKASAPTAKAATPKAASPKIAAPSPAPSQDPASSPAVAALASMPLAAMASPPPAEIAPVEPAPAATAKAAEPSRIAEPRDIKPAPTLAPVMAAAEAPVPAAPPRRPSELDTVATAAAATATPAVVRTVDMAPQPVSASLASTAPAETPAPMAPTPVSSTAQPVEAPAQSAALAPAPQNAGKQSLRIPFTSEAANLPDTAKGDLKQIAGQMTKDAAMRVQVMAYASGNDDAGKARRLSLSRALSIRTYLIEQGIGSTRIDVRALGNNAEGGPSDRVDLMIISR